MKLVVDSNILFSCFMPNSTAKKIVLSRIVDLYAPGFALDELARHQEEIIRKARISKGEFDEITTDLALAVDFIPLTDYAKYIRKVASPDPDDIDFIALVCKLELPLWSNDKKLKQSKITVFTTQDIIENFLDLMFSDDYFTI